MTDLVYRGCQDKQPVLLALLCNRGSQTRGGFGVHERIIRRGGRSKLNTDHEACAPYVEDMGVNIGVGPKLFKRGKQFL